MFEVNSLYIKKSNIILKRVFLFLSIYLSSFYQLLSQDMNFSDPYSNKMIFSPAYSGISNCSEINLTYNKKYISDYYSVSYSTYFNKYKSGIGINVHNGSQGKGSINNFNIDLIYSYKITINRKKIINTAIQATYFQQNINTEELIFNNQINPITEEITTNNSELYFNTYKDINFSVATAYFSTKYRTGIIIKHIDKFFLKSNTEIITPLIRMHFGRIFNIKNTQKSKKISITPEIIYEFQNNFNDISYGFQIVSNIFLTRLFIKHNIEFNTISPVITAGIYLKSIRLSYSYNLSFNKYISYPNSSNQISMQYKFNCAKKRNSKKTIFCPNF